MIDDKKIAEAAVRNMDIVKWAYCDDIFPKL